MPECHLLVGIVDKYSGILVDGNGGVNVQGLQLVIQQEGLEDISGEIIEIIPFLIRQIQVAINRRITDGKTN